MAGRGAEAGRDRVGQVLPAHQQRGARGRSLARLYDGSASEAENYEERCALAVSTNLRYWRSVSPAGPFVTSPFASGSARYFDAKFANGQWHLFYEFARQDGAHDMRVVVLDASALPAI